MGPKGLALTTDCTERYCAADPREGGKQAVAEAWRNLIAVGARPLALTDNLNFGNPERPEAMGELVGCIEGIGEAARALDFPGRLRQCLALQRDDGLRHSPDPRDRRRRPRRRRGENGEPRFQGGGRGHLARRRRAELARPLRLARDGRRPRGGRAAAGRSCGRAPQRRVRRLADPRRRRSARSTTCPTAASPWRWPRWRWRGELARPSRRRAA